MRPQIGQGAYSIVPQVDFPTDAAFGMVERQALALRWLEVLAHLDHLLQSSGMQPRWPDALRAVRASRERVAARIPLLGFSMQVSPVVGTVEEGSGAPDATHLLQGHVELSRLLRGLVSRAVAVEDGGSLELACSLLQVHEQVIGHLYREQVQARPIDEVASAHPTR